MGCGYDVRGVGLRRCIGVGLRRSIGCGYGWIVGVVMEVEECGYGQRDACLRWSIVDVFRVGMGVVMAEYRVCGYDVRGVWLRRVGDVGNPYAISRWYDEKGCAYDF